MKKHSLFARLFAPFTKKRTFRFLDEKQLFQNAPLTYKVIAFVIGVIIAVVSLTTIARTNNALLVEVPTSGGTLHEGIVGIPRYINPVLAVSNADRDLTTLVYAGLMKKTKNGGLEPELAQSYTMSDDGLVYTFTLRDDIYFHDDVRITAQDVAFTIQKTQDTAISSPEIGNWSNIDVQVLSTDQIQFTLPEPYAPFLHNTTIGILPKHLWENTSAEQFAFNIFNIEAIGSGPYQIKEIKRKDGIPEVFHLEPSEEYPLGKPFIDNILIHIYPNEDALITALSKRTIDSAPGISPDRIEEIDKEHHTIVSTPLPRIFFVYLNQNKSDIFTETDARRAFDIALDKKRIAENLFGEYATPLDSPLPPNMLVETNIASSYSKEEAGALLDSAGWTFASSTARENDGQPLTFKLTTSNNPNLKATAEHVKKQLEEVGVDVDLEFYDLQDLKHNIIRPREFQALLFGALLDPSLDLYPLWHSSQRNDPGLNISQYTDIEVDADLEVARSDNDLGVRTEALTRAIKQIQKDTPALPLYAPHFIYVQPQHVRNNTLEYITSNSDRFIDVHTWHIETRYVWLPFTQTF